MANQIFPLILDLRGGRNGGDSPLSPSLGELNQCAEAINVDWYKGMVGRKRGGADSLALTGGTAPTYPINALYRFVPGKDETAAELWSVDAAATPLFKRLAGGTAWADVTCIDACTSRPQDIQFATLNGKVFIAYASAVDRLHVYNPKETTPQIRRVGIDPGSTAPTAANTGAGAYAATLRYYRQRFLLKDATGTYTVVKSEPTPSVSFTPSGAGTAARVTKAATPAGETVSHWLLEVSLDNTVFYELATTAIGTSTYDDSTATTAYSAGTLSDTLGTYTLPTSVRFLVTDGERLLMSGANSSTGQNSRVWWTPVLGSGTADDERIPVITNGFRYYTDVGENDGGAVTAMGGPLAGSRIYVFKYRSIWMLVPTGDSITPYLQRKTIFSVGAIDQSCVVVATNVAGNPAIYFLSAHGPYRVSAGGLEFLGFDITDIWDLVNLDATGKAAHAVFYAQLGQVWFWIATSGANDPTLKLVFDIRQARASGDGEVRRGWSIHNGITANARCSCIFSDVVGAAMDLHTKPYISRATGGSSKLLKCDTTATSDDGTTFQAYVTTRVLSLVGQSGLSANPSQPLIVAEASEGFSLQMTLMKDFDPEQAPISSVSLTPAGQETRVIRIFQDLEVAEAKALQITLGDAQAVASSWIVDQMMIPEESGAPVP